ncbi:MAG: hypothetical protein AVDCRST_MAG91-441 [uncultured Sphingomonadaceae bacterium]|uniref:Uncharacterized protein n=1 Tax=uncultured Sphingomonadaceae bacterium TaxID=169976 RepID=A0A6J4S3S6_9SPHN|nr:MAG: hypothetical protein AVDCRST_MAG91-441 [uncultured Sphingomonadaceae bacterium]
MRSTRFRTLSEAEALPGIGHPFIPVHGRFQAFRGHAYQ